MSAGGLSYSGIVNYGKVTLPSVETWGTNMNILRDPPKSIQTRRIDKVGDTSEITQMIQESGDRISGINDTILVYARGVNPMVAVSYDNFGNNGGQKKGGAAGPSSSGLAYGNTGKSQAFLPYRIMNGGAFRPPIKDQRDLLPLSRLPRIWTSSFSKPGFVDFSKKAMCPGSADEYRQIRSEERMLRPCVKPTATFSIEAPVLEGFEVRSVIKNPVKVSYSNYKESTGKFNGDLGVPTKQIKEETLKPEYNSNLKANARNGDTELDTERYTHDTLRGNFETNLSSGVNRTSLEDLVDPSNHIKDAQHISYTAPVSGYEAESMDNNREYALRAVNPVYDVYTHRTENIHRNSTDQKVPELTMNRPVTEAYSNAGGVRRVDLEYSRDAVLRPTIPRGSMEPLPTMPVVYRDNDVIEFDQHRSEMRRRVYDMQSERGVPPRFENATPTYGEIYA